MKTKNQNIADNLSEKLIQFEAQWNIAIEQNNVQSISSFMSGDWVIIGTEGGVTSRAAFLRAIESGDLIHTKMDFKCERIAIYENTGVATFKGTSSGTYKKQPFSFYEWSTSVFVYDNDRWKCVLTMLTPAK